MNSIQPISKPKAVSLMVTATLFNGKHPLTNLMEEFICNYIDSSHSSQLINYLPLEEKENPFSGLHKKNVLYHVIFLCYDGKGTSIIKAPALIIDSLLGPKLHPHQHDQISSLNVFFNDHKIEHNVY